MAPSWFVLLVGVVVVAALPNAAAKFVEVDTIYGRIRGVEEADPPVTAFYGVPFARPPVKDLRWAPPQLPERWNNTRDCTRDLFFHVRIPVRPIILAYCVVRRCVRSSTFPRTSRTAPRTAST